MRQLVGLRCARCERAIPSIIDGRFCSECACPVHNRCAVPDPEKLESCPICGSSVQAVAENREEEKADAKTLELDVRFNNGARHIGMGFFCIVGSIFGAFFCGYFGLILFVIGLVQVMIGIVVFMRKRPPEY